MSDITNVFDKSSFAATDTNYSSLEKTLDIWNDSNLKNLFHNINTNLGEFLRGNGIHLYKDFDDQVFWEAFSAHFKISNSIETRTVTRIQHLLRRLVAMTKLNNDLKEPLDKLQNHISYISDVDIDNLTKSILLKKQNVLYIENEDNTIIDRAKNVLEDMENKYDIVVKFGEKASDTIHSFRELASNVMAKTSLPYNSDVTAVALYETVKDNITKDDMTIGIDELIQLIEYNHNEAQNLRKNVDKNNNTLADVLAKIKKKREDATNTYNGLKEFIRKYPMFIKDPTKIEETVDGIFAAIVDDANAAEDLVKGMNSDVTASDLKGLQAILEQQDSVGKNLGRILVGMQAKHTELENIQQRLNVDTIYAAKNQLQNIKEKAGDILADITSLLKDSGMDPNTVSTDKLVNLLQDLYGITIADIESASSVLIRATKLLEDINAEASRIKRDIATIKVARDQLQGMQVEGKKVSADVDSMFNNPANNGITVSRDKFDEMVKQLQVVKISNIESVQPMLEAASELLREIKEEANRIREEMEAATRQNAEKQKEKDEQQEKRKRIDNFFKVLNDRLDTENQCSKKMDIDTLLSKEDEFIRYQIDVDKIVDEYAEDQDSDLKKRMEEKANDISIRIKASLDACRKLMQDKIKGHNLSGAGFTKLRDNYFAVMNVTDTLPKELKINVDNKFKKYVDIVRELIFNGDFVKLVHQDVEHPKRVFEGLKHYIFQKGPNDTQLSFNILLSQIPYVMKPADRFGKEAYPYFGKIQPVTYGRIPEMRRTGKMTIGYMARDTEAKYIQEWVKAAVKHIYFNQLLDKIVKLDMTNVVRYSHIPNMLWSKGIVDEEHKIKWEKEIRILERRYNIFSEDGDSTIQEMIDAVEEYVRKPPTLTGGGSSLIQVLDVIYFVLTVLFAAAISIFLHEAVEQKCQRLEMMNCLLYANTSFLVLYTVITMVMWYALDFPADLLMYHLALLYLLVMALTMLQSAWPSLTKKVSMAGLIMAAWCMSVFVPIVYTA